MSWRGSGGGGLHGPLGSGGSVSLSMQTIAGAGLAAPAAVQAYSSKARRRRSHPASAVRLLLVAALLCLAWWYLPRHWLHSLPGSSSSSYYARVPVLVSYAYFEKDQTQMFNFDYFLQAGYVNPPSQELQWAFVVSTDICTPCATYLNQLTPQLPMPSIGAKRVAVSHDTVLIHRTENAGMDVGSHNVTLEYLKSKRRLWRYAFYIFINSSTRGPFYPSYMPAGWHWTHAFLSRMARGGRVLPPQRSGKGGAQGPLQRQNHNVHAVGSSLVCLPDIDAGGPGPRLESWAYALSSAGFKVAISSGAYRVRGCKKCADAEHGIIVGGEYLLSAALLDAGLNLATLMSKYAPGVDWSDKRHWGCNDNVHPSRHGTYDGIAFHPYETLFIKSSWHVGDPYTKRYTIWGIQHLQGDPGTEGELNLDMYTYGVSNQAILPNLLEAAYNVSRIQHLVKVQREAVQQALQHASLLGAASAASGHAPVAASAGVSSGAAGGAGGSETVHGKVEGQNADGHGLAREAGGHESEDEDGPLPSVGVHIAGSIL